MSVAVAAGNLLLVCEAAERCYGLAPTRLLAAAGLGPASLHDPAALVPARALERMLRFVLAESADPAFGIRMGEGMDLRTQGFWGYALLSSQSLRERIDVHLRYQRLRAPVEVALRIEGDLVTIDCLWGDFAPDLLPLLTDCGVTRSCLEFTRRAQGRKIDLQVWLSYREQPHHRELRELVGGRIEFDASCTRLQFPASELDRPRSEGDPHLHVLAATQLDRQLEVVCQQADRELVDRVRHSVLAHLESDASLGRVARDLHTSARTLQRQLGVLGLSFHELLDNVRRERAIRYLVDTDEAVERVALRLGYGDASNFRRAFRRWTGVTPVAFRATRAAPTQRPRSESVEPHQA